MATLTETAYGKLLSQTRPRVIKTEAENQRALAEPRSARHAGPPPHP